MTAPIIWILFPTIVAILIWIFNSRQVLANTLASLTCLFLAIFAWLVPIGAPVQAGPFAPVIGTTLSILGRRFILETGDRPLLVLIYLFGALWFFGANFTRVHRFFAPMGIVIIALMVAAFAVEPFLYAALIIEMVVLLSVPLLVNPGQIVGQGVLRYLIFQSLAVPFILIAGWFAARVEANPTDAQSLIIAVALLGLGFAFWLAIFPFYSWVPLLSQEANPFVAGFLLSMLPTMILLLMLAFLNNFAWLREFPTVSTALQIMGLLMVVTAGIWAAFQNDLSRMFGYAVILENGFALIALSLENVAGFEIFVASFLARLVALGLWSFGLSLLKEAGGTDFVSLSGIMRKYPIASGAVIAALFSITGLPLLAAFPIREVLLENVARQSLVVTFWVGIGASAMILGGIRALSAMVSGTQSKWGLTERWPQAALLVLGMAAILVIGILPGWFLPGILKILAAYTHLR